ncbi:cytochrome P450 6k1-like [Schistocerca piceifrons]|uniref:cytochrome P450 6k1-like n=1 Tax=Schistocerca piceifrons TaxID=274613 RepID=UPI001F5F003C|nr:cytochrome P450 6k1-like [Schistocerca piceifrons]
MEWITAVLSLVALALVAFLAARARYYAELRRRSPGEALARLYRRLAPLPAAGVFLRTTPALLVRDPDVVAAVLDTNFACFADRHMRTRDSDSLLRANDLSLMPGGDGRWASLRGRLAAAVFGDARTEAAFPSLAAVAGRLAQSLRRAAGIVDVHDYATRFAIDIAASAVFGRPCDALARPQNDFSRWVKDRKNPLAEYFLEAMVMDTVNYRALTGTRRADYLQLLIDATKSSTQDGVRFRPRQPQGPAATVAEAAGPAESFRLGGVELRALPVWYLDSGVETVASALAFCLHELALDTPVQAAVRAEVDATLRHHDGQLSYAAVKHLPYLDTVIAETLRKYPPVETVTRVTNGEFRVPGFSATLPRGTLVLVSVLGLHRDPAYFPDPDRFDPDRFREDVRRRRHPYVYLPFGAGPRACFGNELALLILKMAVAAILSEVELRVCYRTKMPLRIDPTRKIMTPKGGAWLNVLPRD